MTTKEEIETQKYARRVFTIDDMKSAYNAGGHIISWSDEGYEEKWKNFEAWYRTKYINNQQNQTK